MAQEIGIVAIPQRDPSPNCSIYKIPGWITELHQDAYKPRVVSLGPYHFGDPELRPMEVYKEKILHRFLKHTGKSMEECIKMLSGIAQQLMDAYDSLELRWTENPKEFLELMLRDGVFMLEILRQHFGGRINSKNALNDHIFNTHGTVYRLQIMRDMLMLENQLPLQLILTEFLYDKDEDVSNDYLERINHPRRIMILLRSFYLYVSKSPGSLASLPLQLEECQHLPEYLGDKVPISASKLREAGIKIIKSQTGSISEGIRFRLENFGLTGVIILPELHIHRYTVVALLNIVAFEKLHRMDYTEVSSYLSFMDDLVKVEKDVEILEDIIVNRYGNDEAVAKWFNGLPRYFRYEHSDSNYYLVASDVNRFCNRWWVRWRRYIMHNYFSDPWTLALRFGGSLFFLLTVIQTVFTVGQYYQGKDKK